MSFTSAIATCFRKYATFSGRASRSEFWWFYLLTVIISVAFFVVLFGVAIAGGALSRETDTPADVGGGVGFLLVNGLSVLVSLALLLPTLAVVWRRLHDTDRTGLWWFIGLVPLVGIIVLIVFWSQDSTRGANRFGPSPKDPAAQAGSSQSGYAAPQQGYGYPG